MQTSPSTLKYVPMRSPTPPLGSSTEDLDEMRLEQQFEELESNTNETKKPHFLDYDSIPPPGFDDRCIAITPGQVSGFEKHPGEILKVDKIYEKDGEVSDFEFAATIERRIHRSEKLGVEKEFANGGAATHSTATSTASLPNDLSEPKGGTRKKKHFLDENPIPPDYEHHEREHSSLDRTYDQSSKDFDPIRSERKHSLDRGRSKKVKEPSYALSRFLQTDDSPMLRGTWPVNKTHDLPGSGGNMPCDEVAQLNPKVAGMYSLLSMLGCENNSLEITSKFLELSKSVETCTSLRQAGCIPLLVQKIHSDTDEVAKEYATKALRNVVNQNCHPDDKTARREAKVLRHIEQIMEYTIMLKTMLNNGETAADDSDQHPLQAMCSLMKVSFDEEHREAMSLLGALQAIANIVHFDHTAHGTDSRDPKCIQLRRYAMMALTNLTFGHDNNKKLLCANRDFMKALVGQIDSNGDELIQVTANVLRNLSWHPNENMKTVLNEIKTVTALTKAVMTNTNENTIRAILSALWNLSAYSGNRIEFCEVDGALSFLVDMLTFKENSKTSMAIIENAGGILSNVSVNIARNEEYRKILRQKNCLGILLQQLKSESLTVVNNACGTLWNLSARCREDQQFLWDNGAVPMLRSLINSKHPMISKGSNAALRNLLNFKPGEMNHNHLDPIAKMMGLKELPSLNMRKQKALQQELDQNLAETCDNLDLTTPTKEEKSTLGAVINNVPMRQCRSASASGHAYNSMAVSSSMSMTVGTTKPDIAQRQHQQRSQSTGAVKKQAVDKHDGIVPPIPARRSKQNSMEDGPSSAKYQETDLDQITNFSLLYAENQNESSDADELKPKHRWDAFGMIDDTVKCYETEGTPYTMSSAASVSDLRQTKSAGNCTANKSSKSRTVEHSGINTPEKPIKYCEEGTPGYISVHNSFSSLDEEEGSNDTPALPLAVAPVNASAAPDTMELRNNDEAHLVIQSPNEYEQPRSSHLGMCNGANGGSGSVSGFATVPTTPGGTASKAVTFTEFMETPLMLSQRSSIESLGSIEPNMADDKSSVVSEVSRMSSGLISPSDLPDSPSQTIPQSPRCIAERMTTSPLPLNLNNSDGRLRSVFEDQVNTFGVENTPAQFSCATSLSNLSLDDEPKIATDGLIKEMRLMNHPSDDQDDGAIDICGEGSGLSVGNGVVTANTSSNDSEHNIPDDNSAFSDSDESAKDSLLLEQCINMGHAIKQSGPRSQSNSIAPPLPPKNVPRNGITDDGICTNVSLNNFTENGVDSVDKCLNVQQNNDDCSSTDGSDIGNEDILEQCILNGIKKSINPSKPIVAQRNAAANGPMLPHKLIKENPIGMFRQGGNTSPPMQLDNTDEVTRHQQEGTPCNYSVMSALSDLTVDSNVAGLVNPIRLQSEPVPADFPDDPHIMYAMALDSERDGQPSQGAPINTEQMPKNPPIPPRKPINLLPPPPTTSKPNQASKSLATIPTNYNQNPDTNDSLSSIDSNDETNEQLLEQCISMGWQKMTTMNTVNKQQQSPKRSQLPVFRSVSQIERDRQKESADSLLRDTSTEMTVRTDSTIVGAPVRQSRVSVKHQQQQQQPQSSNNIGSLIIKPRTSSVGSKNVEATSAAVSVTTMSSVGALSTAPGVETAMHKITNGYGTDHRQPHADKNQQQMPTVASISQNKVNGVATKPTTTIRIGFNSSENANANESVHSLYDNGLQMSSASMNFSCDSNNLFDHSNEYPASALSNLDDNDDSINESSIDMEVSNEFLTESFEGISASQKVDKHKDPDLMLRSVERLTHELVSTAEYLRTSSSRNVDLASEVRKSNGSAANHTWNEDSDANEISYPSLSITAPIIASMNDTDTSSSNTSNVIRYESIVKMQVVVDPTPTNEHCSFIIPRTSIDCADGHQLQPDSMNSDTDTLVENMGGGTSNDGSVINFHVGGEVQQSFGDNLSNYLSTSPYSVETYSSMTKSTMIAMEANKLRADLFNMSPLTDSMNSLDLDHIRPPSVMDNVSMSSHLDAPNSPQLSGLRKKSLPQGIMARRLLTHNNPNGSLESVNSSCNLDNIKPPSLMDELLDSMISVDSITSEVVEHTYVANNHDAANGDEVSQYETANSEYDDTTTLRSCLDLPVDTTPIPSDFSSAESTPRRCRKQTPLSMTPVQRRQANKERYRTYTIPGEQANDNGAESSLDMATNTSIDDDDASVSDEMIHIEIEENSPRRVTPRQRRQEDRSRFQTQILDSEMIAKSSSSVESSPQAPRRSRDNARYLTRTISHDETKAQRQNHFCEAVVNDDERDRTLRGHSHEFLLNDDSDSISLVSTDNDEMSSIRALTQPFKHLRDLSAATNGLPKRANAHVFTAIRQSEHVDLHLDSIEYDRVIEPESNDHDHDIDEETYTIQHHKPRIIKPNDRDRSLDSGNSDGSANSPESKAIRGRKKAAYVSPYKAQMNCVQKTSPSKTAESPKTISTGRPKSNATKTVGILTKTNFTSQLNSVKKSLSKTVITSKLGRKNTVAEKNIANQPKCLATNGCAGTDTVATSSKSPTVVTSLSPSPLSSTPPQMPDRQGTFIKDKPSIIDVPVVYSEPSSPLKSASIQSKIPSSKSTTIATPKSFISKLRSPLQRSATTTQPISSIVSQSKRNSIVGGVYKSPSTPYVSQRSNSNASMKSTASSSSSTTKQSFSSQPPSRSNSNISSRIAGLWKRSNSDAKNSPVAAGNRSTTNFSATSRPPSGSKHTTFTAASAVRDRKTTTVPKAPMNVDKKTVAATAKTSGGVPRATGNMLSGVILRGKNDAKVKSAEDGTKRISRLGSFV